MTQYDLAISIQRRVTEDAKPVTLQEVRFTCHHPTTAKWFLVRARRYIDALVRWVR